MPQMDTGLILELPSFFYFIFLISMGQHIILTIKQTSLLIKLRHFYIEYYNDAKLKLNVEKLFVQNQYMASF